MTNDTQPGADIVADAREWLAVYAVWGWREKTHFDGCHRSHSSCLIARLADECERLSEAIRRLADQDATLSVSGGNVTVTMDATLTDEEREAFYECYEWAMTADHSRLAATLRSLLERTK
jgi:hypothetical protein